MQSSIPLDSNPGGTNGQVQFNDNGIFGGAGGFLWDKASSSLVLYRANASLSAIVFTGTGLDDIVVTGDFFGNAATVVIVEIYYDDMDEAFRYSLDGGGSWAGYVMASCPVTTAAGFIIDFVGRGHTAGDSWTFTWTPPDRVLDVRQSNEASLFSIDMAGNICVGAPRDKAIQFTGENILIGIGVTSILAAGSLGNTVLGSTAAAGLSDGISNTIVGVNAGNVISTGNRNTCIGQGAGDFFDLGNDNTLLGYISGHRLSGASDFNIFIGSASGTGDGFSRVISHSISIGCNTTVTTDYELNIGNVILGSLATGDLTIGSRIKTADIGAHAAQYWKLGTVQAGAGLVLDATSYVEVEINGAPVKLAIVN